MSTRTGLIGVCCSGCVVPLVWPCGPRAARTGFTLSITVYTFPACCRCTKSSSPQPSQPIRIHAALLPFSSVPAPIKIVLAELALLGARAYSSSQLCRRCRKEMMCCGGEGPAKALESHYRIYSVSAILTAQHSRNNSAVEKIAEVERLDYPSI
jgi:hypothetical protein